MMTILGTTLCLLHQPVLNFIKKGKKNNKQNHIPVSRAH